MLTWRLYSAIAVLVQRAGMLTTNATVYLMKIQVKSHSVYAIYVAMSQK